MGFTLLDPERRLAQAFLESVEQARQDAEDWQRMREQVLGAPDLPVQPTTPYLKLVWVNPEYECVRVWGSE